MTNEQLIYVSFLGAGPYQVSEYLWQGKTSKQTKYIQIAALDILKKSVSQVPNFVLIFGTETSKNVHWTSEGGLRQQLQEFGLKEELAI